ncbi:PAP fibrillin [Aureococcus anophagefferens]|nr:PAP fibrillin [Aureococcus anophagefferens]
MSIFVFAVCAARGDALLVPGRPHALHGSRRATKSAATASLRMSAAQQELRPASLALEIPRQAADDVLAWASAGGRGAPPEDDAATFGYDGLEVRRTTSSMMTRQQTSLGRTSSKDWLHCLSTWPRSYVLERIKNPLAAIVGCCTCRASRARPRAAPLGGGARRRPSAKEVLRLFRRVGGGADGAPIPLETFLGALRDMPDVAAALGVPTDLEAHALDQLHLLKFDEPRSARAPVTVNELAAYYSPLQLWHALRQAGAANRDVASSTARRSYVNELTLFDALTVAVRASFEPRADDELRVTFEAIEVAAFEDRSSGRSARRPSGPGA